MRKSLLSFLSVVFVVCAGIWGSLCARDSHTHLPHFYTIEHSAPHNLSPYNLSLPPATPSRDDELHRHLESFSAARSEEDALGLAGAHKKRQHMQDYADYISKPPIFYNRGILQSRERPELP